MSVSRKHPPSSPHIFLFLEPTNVPCVLLRMASTPPKNFSWVDPGKVAGLALPRMTAEYQYLLDQGIRHLVCLCECKPPNYDTCPTLQLHHIKISDFTPPSPSQIDKFLAIVDEANSKGEVQDFRDIRGFRSAMFLVPSVLPRDILHW